MVGGIRVDGRTRCGCPHDVGEQGMQAQRGNPERVECRTRPAAGLEVDQHHPAGVQRLSGLVAGRGFFGGPDRADVARGRLRGRLDGFALRATESRECPGHVHQPRECATGQDQQPHLPRRHLGSRQPGARGAGQHQHVRPGRTDREGIADERRNDGHRTHGQHTQPRDGGRPVAQGNEKCQARRQPSEEAGAVNVRTVGSIQRGERADGGQQPGGDVADGPPNQHRYRHAQTRPQRERRPPGWPRAQDEHLADRIAVWHRCRAPRVLRSHGTSHSRHSPDWNGRNRSRNRP